MKSVTKKYHNSTVKLAIAFLLSMSLIFSGIFLVVDNLSSIHRNLNNISAFSLSQVRHLNNLTTSEEANRDLLLITDSKDQITQAVTNIKYILYTGLFILVIFAVIIFIDSRLNKEYKKELVKAKEKAESLAGVKQLFISNMSHEMKTPLHAILGFTEELKRDKKLNLAGNDILKRINISSTRLLNMVEDLLILSNKEMQSDNSYNGSFDLKPLVQDTFNGFKEKAETKGLQFHCRCPMIEGIEIIGDPRKLTHIISNLLDNSLKFTTKGFIELICETEIKDSTSCHVNIKVRDSGIGIDEDRLEIIFQDFEQLDGSITKGYAGIGIGLSVTKKLVEWQGGTIQAKSVKDKFTEFSVTIPYGYIRKDQAAGEIVHPFQKALKALVVDDDHFNVLLAQAMLTKWGFETDTANNGFEALQKLKTSLYDVLILDIHMPGMSGLDVAATVKKKAVAFGDMLNKNIPIIAVTATLINEVQVEKFKEVGINEYLSKPFNEKQLLGVLLKLMNTNTMNVDLSSGHSSASDSSLYNLDSLYQITGGERDFMSEMLETFLVSNKASLKDLIQAYTVRDYKQAGELAHRMLSSYKHLQVHSLMNTLTILEGMVWNPNPPENGRELIQELETVSAKLFIALEDERKKISDTSGVA